VLTVKCGSVLLAISLQQGWFPGGHDDRKIWNADLVVELWLTMLDRDW